MENTLQEVAEKCANELFALQACVTSHPNDWDAACWRQRQALTKCSEDNVAVLRKVKEACADAIKLYDDCLQANPQDPKPCLAPLRDLYNCTEKTAGVSFGAPPPTPAPEAGQQ
ncbi:hypothetical protein SAICODRAFT_9361 [Saitoella complicata NRRL Y-17804]|uniref:uncharacterized protein n=1 Tax=Saitoella complicata (strain BCRC 22490 / CBS 7301 / JCM 7358 / NBRC 10748 / NRRL Y-17804) TaxID=698492 RepID=UPI00086807C9|nr:uncharacterized protein SAICODRAFT_9361 [Saitoella complicata NRRL Y-17804]ODQ51034.1 hypothetical protein SAICODRAFT_9361 [Saitoella complicata NRRL Y-17804]